MNFTKIFEYTSKSPAKILRNMSYFEYATNLLFRAGDKIGGSEGDKIFFEERHYTNKHKLNNRGYSDFVHAFKNAFINSTGRTVYYVIGIPGIGKTLFFKEGVKKLFRDQVETQGKYIEFRIEFKYIPQLES